MSRWKGSYEQGLPIVRKASPILKGAGVTSVRAGICHSGPGTGLMYTTVTFPDWRHMEGCKRMPNFEFLKVVQLQDRSIIVGEEL